MEASTLTAKQAKFVSEFLVDGCGAKAAVRSGIAPSGAHVWASRTLRIAKVSEALQARQIADATRLSLQRENVLNGLLEAIDHAREQSNPMAMIRGWAEIAKMMGFNAPERVKVDMSVKEQLEMKRLNTMSDQQLLAMIEAGRTVSQ